MTDLLGAVLTERPPPFALLHRPQSGGPDRIDVIIGDVSHVDTLADIPLPEAPAGDDARHEVLVAVPYRQIAERGFAAVDDLSPLIAMAVREQAVVPVAEVLRRVPDLPIDAADGQFDVSDEEYAELVRRVIAEEIGQGKGANFVVKRSFVTDILGYSPRSALTFFRRLLERESGAYWTFIVHTPERTFVGASPERHISVRGGVAVMNPISGTYRYPPSGPALPEIIDFLADRKETDELFMVVDEELKMMSRVCDSGARVVGPYLKEMSRLAHTEYFIEGRTTRDVREILRETMFAPTVTGSPLESASRVIAEYEPHGRGYYSGLVALVGRDEFGDRELDSSILIRNADIDRAGRVRIGVGATLVRHSDPDSEVAETRAKAAGLLSALGAGPPARFGSHPDVLAALAERNEAIAAFWREPSPGGSAADGPLSGRRVLIVDAEDTFTSMIEQQLRSFGLTVTVRRFDEPYILEGYDLVVMGPGPGDPRAVEDPKITHLRTTIGRLLAERRRFLAVCLSHQVLCSQLGLPLVRRPVPNQGVQKEIDLFGRAVRVGFYNTFAGRSDADKIERDEAGVIEISRDPPTGEIHALRADRFQSVQFHAESVLSFDGVSILRDAITALLPPARPRRRAAA